jgi:hypothetical protein
MRRFLLLLLLALPAAGILATGPPIQWAEAQKPKGEPEQPDDEPAAPEKLGKLTLTFDAGWHTDPVRKVVFTPDGNVITLSADHSIRIWDPDTGEMLKVLYPPGFGGLGAAALSADGKRLALASRYAEGDQVFAGRQQEEEATVEFREARQSHPGVESAIGALQAGNGQERCRDRSKLGYERYVGLGILGRNLQVLGKLLLAQDAAKCEAAKSKRKPQAG